jgi:hypothetical protein
VLDDVLKSWFDPETGWFACWISFFIGNATMYSLPMTDEQRVRLVQSCLWTDEEQARSILTSPGGFQVMLPEKLQLWLNGDKVEEIQVSSNGNENECDRSNSTEETEPSEAETKATQDLDEECDEREALRSDSKRGNAVKRRRGLETEKRTGSAAALPPPLFVQSPQVSHHPQYPLDAMGTILKEMVMDFIKRICTRIPESSVQGLAVAASAAFALQMYKSPRSRRLVINAVEGTTALTFASVAVGSIAALITKARILEQSASSEQQSSFFRSILAKVHGAGSLRRVQGMIAVLVLWYVGRRRTDRIQSHAHLQQR